LANVHRFLAAPNPPGKTTASNAAGSSVDSGAISPRAIRAASTSWFRVSPGTGSPVRWFTTSVCGASGAKHRYAAPRRARWMRQETASWISLPSARPQPDRTTAMLGMGYLRLRTGTALPRFLRPDLRPDRTAAAAHWAPGANIGPPRFFSDPGGGG